MTIPTTDQIEKVANDYVAALGGSAVHLRVSDVMLSIDAAYPGMTDSEFDAVRVKCSDVVGKLRATALHQMWGDAA